MHPPAAKRRRLKETVRAFVFHFKFGNLKEKVRKDCVVCCNLIDNYLLFIGGERKDRVDVILVCGGRRRG